MPHARSRPRRRRDAGEASRVALRPCPAPRALYEHIELLFSESAAKPLSMRVSAFLGVNYTSQACDMDITGLYPGHSQAASNVTLV